MRQFRKLVDPIHARLISLENGEDRSAATLALLHALGVDDGVPDLLLIMTRGRAHWIEVKLDATLTHARTDLFDAQSAFHAGLGGLGHAVSVVRSAPEFWAIVDRYHVPHAPVPQTAEQLVLPRPRRRPRKRASASAPAPCGPA